MPFGQSEGGLRRERHHHGCPSSSRNHRRLLPSAGQSRRGNRTNRLSSCLELYILFGLYESKIQAYSIYFAKKVGCSGRMTTRGHGQVGVTTVNTARVSSAPVTGSLSGGLGERCSFGLTA